MDWTMFEWGSKQNAGNVPAGGSAPVSVYDQLKKAGLAAGLKPDGKTALAVAPILNASGISAEDACLLQAWLGGAHEQDDPQFSFVSWDLSAQAACGLSKPWFGFFGHSVYDALASLAKFDAKAAELVKSCGEAKAKASAKKQTAEAEADAKKIGEQALSVVTTSAIGVGTIAAVALVAYVAFLVVTTKE